MLLLENKMMEINRDKYKGFNEIQPFYHLSRLGERMKPFVLDIAEKGISRPELNIRCG